MTSEAITNRIKRNVLAFAPASYAMCAKIAFVPKQAADSATRNTPIKRSIGELSNFQPLASSLIEKET
jgi:hypothetical protein